MTNISTTYPLLTDKDIAKGKGDKPNVLVVIGVTGMKRAILNPASAADALRRFHEITGMEADEDDAIEVIGFDDVFTVYEAWAND